MHFRKLLIANRGEIAVRIAAACAEAGVPSLAVAPQDDAQCLHRFKADESHWLEGAGAAAYLDVAQILQVALQTGCDAIHPGYGFLAENADFAERCVAAGITFVGPAAETLRLFADKAAARSAAVRCGVPVLPGSDGAVSQDGARDFFQSLGPSGVMMIKAVAGGGGRGMRIVRRADEIEEAFAACAAEAEHAFGDRALFVERFLARARHIEIQVLGDGVAVTHLGERECSLQRRNQKLIEIAPCPDLPASLRNRITDAALSMAQSAAYRGIGTFEFLVDAAAMNNTPETAGFYFLEVNPRIQVEHTITEEVTGIDLVRCQLQLAAGARLADLQLPDAKSWKGFALQARINSETISADGVVRPALGQLSVFDPPSGRGLRVDTHGYAGYSINPRYDSLLAKLVVHTRELDFAALLHKARRALGAFRIAGVDTNAAFLESLLGQSEVATGDIHTRFVDETLDRVLATITPPPHHPMGSQAGDLAAQAERMAV